MRAVRKDYFLDHDHSAYVDQWDWERAITAEQRNLDVPERHRAARSGACSAAPRRFRPDRFPQLPTRATRLCPRARRSCTPRTSSTTYPDLPRKQRETAILQEHPAVFISASAGRSPTATRTRCAPPTTTTGSTETVSADGRPMHGLNGDILVWNPVTRRATS